MSRAEKERSRRRNALREAARDHARVRAGKLRKSGRTQREIAVMLGVHPKTVSEWQARECGRCGLTLIDPAPVCEFCKAEEEEAAA